MIDCLMVGLLPSSCFVMVGWLMVYRLVSQDRLFAGVVIGILLKYGR